MIRTCVFLCCLALPLRAETVAEQAAEASAELQQAVAALEAATEARDRVSALSKTIRAYEAGLAALRSALREAALREATLTKAFDAKRDGIGRLLGVLATMEANPGPLLLLHPEGAVGSARSGMILADVAPALQSEAAALKDELRELADLRALQLSAGEILQTGLATAQNARTDLSKAISERTDLPKRFTEDPEVLKGLLDSADTLDAFAAGLSPDAESGTSFATEKAACRCPHLARFSVARERPMPLACDAQALLLRPRPARLSSLRGPPRSVTGGRCWTTVM
jgi:septal ring factor EnvC (AmiA/AmiB activator)